MSHDDWDTELAGIRRSIDNIDAALIHLLAERFKFTQQVGRLKATSTACRRPIPSARGVQIARLRALADEAHLDPAFAEKWFNFVVAEVIHHHERADRHGFGPVQRDADADSGDSEPDGRAAAL